MNELPQRRICSRLSPGHPHHRIRPPPRSAMMARLLTQTLTLARPASSPSTTTAASASLRGLATKVEIIEIDLTEEDAPLSPSAEAVGIRRLEEAIHGAMVRRAAPDWLPFVPGGSFWVPPLRRTPKAAELMGQIAAVGGAARVNELVGRIAAEEATQGAAGAVGGAVEIVELDAPMTEEQALCFPTTRGWPSASFFVKGKSPHSWRESRKGATQTDDEES